MKRIPKVYISLTGGLGNQLFQLGAGLACSQSSDISLVTSFGKPRRGNKQPADVLEFETGLAVETRKASWLARKTAGYILRMSASPRKYESNLLFEVTIKKIASIILSHHLNRVVRILSPRGVGFGELQHLRGSRVMLGYFQSYKWVTQPEVKKRLLDLNLQESNLRVAYYRELSELERPLVVHIRRGDYLNEKSFGVLSQQYYLRAIQSQLSMQTYKAIWLFSDDFELATEIIPRDLGLPVRVVSEFDHSPASTLQVMRFGLGYVIANSSFSWWAAFLSENERAHVIAPNPWFYSLPEPNELIPPSWTRMNASWESIHG